MGRNAQPAAVKEAKGNPGRRRIAKEGPAAAISSIAPPSGLKVGPRRIWERLAPELAGMRILRPSDLTAFRRYCVFVYKWAQVEPMLLGAKATVTTVSAHNPDGLERKSQALLVALMLDKRLSEIEDRFGLNPAARQRLMLQMAQQGALPLQGGAQPTGEPKDSMPLPMVEKTELPESPIGLLQ